LPPEYFGKESQAPDDAPQSRQFQLASDMPRPPDTAFICTSCHVISFLFSLHENESLPIHSVYHTKPWQMEGKWKRRVMPFRQLTPGRSERCECSGNIYIGGTFIHEDIKSAVVEAHTKDILFIPQSIPVWKGSLHNLTSTAWRVALGLYARLSILFIVFIISEVFALTDDNSYHCAPNDSYYYGLEVDCAPSASLFGQMHDFHYTSFRQLVLSSLGQYLYLQMRATRNLHANHLWTIKSGRFYCLKYSSGISRLQNNINNLFQTSHNGTRSVPRPRHH
jgi:hypothetical protein